MLNENESAKDFLLEFCENDKYYNEILSAEGYYDKRGTSINVSSIYTLLIQDAGRFVESYASDLIYGIQKVDKRLNSVEPGAEYFGMREDGVDHLDFIAGSLSSRSMGKYRRLYSVVISTDEDRGKIYVSLRRFDPSMVEYKFRHSFAA